MARNQTTSSKQKKREPVAPKLIAYHVADRGEKGFWTRIGAAWDHKDGEGYTLALDLVPVDGGRIVLRPPRDENGEDGDKSTDADEAEGEDGDDE